MTPANSALRALDSSRLVEERTRQFTGREWVFKVVDGWLSQPHGPRVFLLTGGPGTGKTAIAARMVQVNGGEIPSSWPSLPRDFLTHFHFCQTGLDSTLSPLTFVQSLSQALANRYPAFRRALDLRLNEAKSRIVDLTQGEGFGFLGFDFQPFAHLRGRWRPQYTPKLIQRTAVLGKLKEMFRRHDSQPVGRVIAAINLILRGWVNYFRIGNARRCFAYVRYWIETKVRRHLMGARKQQGFGWKRWSTAWLYERLGLFHDYRVQYLSRA